MFLLVDSLGWLLVQGLVIYLFMVGGHNFRSHGEVFNDQVLAPMNRHMTYTLMDCPWCLAWNHVAPGMLIHLVFPVFLPLTLILGNCEV